MLPFASKAILNSIKSKERAENNNTSDAAKAIASAFANLHAPASRAVPPGQLDNRLQATPGYQFAKNEAVDSIMGNASALGLRQSGANIQNIASAVGNQVALPAYQDYMNRLGSLSGAGTSTSLAQTIGNLATTSGALNANLMQNAGDAKAAGALGQAGAWQNTIGGLSSILGGL